MTDIAANTNKVYIANNDSAALGNVSKAVCVVLPGSFTVAGYDNKGNVLVIDHFTETGMPWEPEYLQAQFGNKSLHNLLKEVTTVFVGYGKHLLVPQSLYKQTEAEAWLRKLHFVEAEDMVLSTKLRDDKTYILHTVHANLREVLGNNLEKGKLLPLSAYQFHRHPPANLVQCCLTGSHVYATCYLEKKLVWHRVFDYTNAEDIAYELELLFKEHNISSGQVRIDCSAATTDQGDIINNLKAYYPDLKDGDAEGEWKGFIYLLQQLYTCA